MAIHTRMGSKIERFLAVRIDNNGVHYYRCLLSADDEPNHWEPKHEINLLELRADGGLDEINSKIKADLNPQTK